MNTPKRAATCRLSILLCLVAGALYAGTTPVHIDTEQGGAVDTGLASQWDGTYENVNGAFFWNGSQWVTNDTAAHEYFTNLATGERLKLHHPNEIDPSPATLGPVAGVPGGNAVTKSLYGYTKAGVAPGARYTYSAVRYDVLQPDGTVIILLSRGTGNGTALPYFDAYLQEPDATGNTLALLGDPVMYRFLGMTPAQAIAQVPDLGGSGVRASLPTCTPSERAQYWLDFNGGSDMGGITWHVATQCLSPVLTAHWGTAFAIDFRIEFTDSLGEIQDIHFLPALASETLDGQAPAVPALGAWGLLLLAACLAAIALRVIR